MTDTRNVEQRITAWLEEDAMRHFPDHLLKRTYEQTRKSKQQTGWRGLLAGLQVSRFATVMASAAVVLVLGGVAFGLFVNRPSVGPGPVVTPTPIPTPAPTLVPTPDPWAAFIGTFVADPGDADQGVQTMTVERVNADSLEIVVVDTIASVCDRTPSTMTGTGHVQDLSKLVIPTPDYTCDDGSTPHLVNGDPTPLNEVFRNLTYTLDDDTGNLFVGETDEWVRQPDPDPSSTPEPSTNASPAPSSEPTSAPTPDASSSPVAGSLPIGPYVLDPGRQHGEDRVTVTIPTTGWVAGPFAGSVTKDLGGDNRVTLVAVPGDHYSVPQNFCSWNIDPDATEKRIANSVDELVTWLMDQTYDGAEGPITRQFSDPETIAVDGHPGKAITSVVPIDANSDREACDPDESEGQFSQQRVFCNLMDRDGFGCQLAHLEPGALDKVWVVDTGQAWFRVIAASYQPTTSPDLLVEMNSLVDSMTFAGTE